MAIEEPPYVLFFVEGHFEVRDYPAVIAAEVTVPKGASAQGNAFRALARYIFGGNRPQARIAMTAPVTVLRGERIAMTAPVTAQTSSSGLTMRFVMPRAFSLSTLPEPLDADVRVKELPAERVAVVKFTGLWTEAHIEAKASELRAWTAAHGFTATGAYRTAFYDSPFTIPWLRRNEIWIPIAKS